MFLEVKGGRQMVGISADLNIVSCSFRNHPDVKNGDNTKPWKHTTNGKAYCVLKKYITLGKKLAIINKLQSSLKLDRLIIKTIFLMNLIFQQKIMIYLIF